MMGVVFICETMSINSCEERLHDFFPEPSDACIRAAGPELARITPDGWGIDYWRCIKTDASVDAFADAIPHREGGDAP